MLLYVYYGFERQPDNHEAAVPMLGGLSVVEALTNTRASGIPTRTIYDAIAVLALEESDKPLTRQAIAECMRKTPASVTKIANHLTGLGLVEQGATIVGTGRPYKTYRVTQSLRDAIDTMPELSEAIEARRVKAELDALAEERGVSQMAIMRELIDFYKANQPAEDS